jgi:signal transduction histidine kinase
LALATIRRNVELESQLIDDLLDLTRITRDKMQLTLVPVDAHQAISNVVEICREELSTRKLKLEINLRAEAHHISADTAKFQQIAWNLLKKPSSLQARKVKSQSQLRIHHHTPSRSPCITKGGVAG